MKEAKFVDLLRILTGGYYSLLLCISISFLSTIVLFLVFRDNMLEGTMLINTTNSNFSLLFASIELLIIASFAIAFWYSVIKSFIKNGKTDWAYFELWNPIFLTIVLISTVGLIYLASYYLASYEVIKILTPSWYLKWTNFPRYSYWDWWTI